MEGFIILFVFMVICWQVYEYAAGQWRKGDPKREEYYRKYGINKLDDQLTPRQSGENLDKEKHKRILKQMQQEGRAWTERVQVIKTPLFSDAQMAEYGRQMAQHEKERIQRLLDSGLTKQDLRDCGINPD